jgi:hypothetical protein
LPRGRRRARFIHCPGLPNNFWRRYADLARKGDQRRPEEDCLVWQRARIVEGPL